jgi:hypothetical protein
MTKDDRTYSTYKFENGVFTPRHLLSRVPETIIFLSEKVILHFDTKLHFNNL